METPLTKKSLGQHWLNDETVLDSIADCASVQMGDTVLEVGPGLGSLTSRLLKRGANVTAVEFDRYLAATLANATRDIVNLSVVNEDILHFDLTQLAPGYKVVANIPYYLTSNLIRVLTESINPFSVAALLIQKEVAERAAAKPGHMSLLSVSAQYYCEVSLGPIVLAELFTPPPKVNSQVLRLEFRHESLFPDIEAKQFFRVVRAGFSQKRKTLLNSLSGGLAIDKDQAKGMLEMSGIPFEKRAQMLSLEDWHRLALKAR